MSDNNDKGGKKIKKNIKKRGKKKMKKNYQMIKDLFIIEKVQIKKRLLKFKKKLIKSQNKKKIILQILKKIYQKDLI